MRDIAALSDYADAADPAVLSLIARTVEHGKRTGRDVSLCGDAASDRREGEDGDQAGGEHSIASYHHNLTSSAMFA